MDIVNIQIGEIAKRVGVSQRTIRYYEEEGLLKPSSVTSAGLRLYTEKEVSRLRFINRLRLLGLSIDSIKITLGLDKPHPSCKKEAMLRSLYALEVAQQKIEEQVELFNIIKQDNEIALASVKECVECTKTSCDGCPLKIHWP
ncbi:MAG: transcriptional regulator [Dehalococcoides mccartyi]|uniref:helix-turn-helix domain-containing protein n=1 Tax=Dehalococcoides mccartyi TaxID=61435 RepID=UPI000804E052|nr:MerR family transcriptional regulator [Dehalococcoides mccartyi]AQW61970.1 transcriptional regulator [Dehalococcoides mccartyi]OBW62905.1 MAG: transcriptional regulator [Dehalococcoides mccartyi]